MPPVAAPLKNPHPVAHGAAAAAAAPISSMSTLFRFSAAIATVRSVVEHVVGRGASVTSLFASIECNATWVRGFI